MARFEEYKDIFVFVEQENGNIAEVSYELISEARKLVASIPEFGYKSSWCIAWRKCKRQSPRSNRSWC